MHPPHPHPHLWKRTNNSTHRSLQSIAGGCRDDCASCAGRRASPAHEAPVPFPISYGQLRCWPLKVTTTCAARQPQHAMPQDRASRHLKPSSLHTAITLVSCIVHHSPHLSFLASTFQQSSIACTQYESCIISSYYMFTHIIHIFIYSFTSHLSFLASISGLSSLNSPMRPRAAEDTSLSRYFLYAARSCEKQQ